MSSNSAAPNFTAPDRPLTWLITGCSSGLGLALVRHILAQPPHTKTGAKHVVIATSRNPSRTPDLAAEVDAHPGSRWLALDIDSPTAGPELVERLETEGTIVDVLVNCAGWSVYGPAEAFTEAEVRGQMETLYFGPYGLMRAVVPGMRRRRFGVVVNFGSAAGLFAVPSLGPYVAAKSALEGLTNVLAKEVAEFNVRALYVSLGGFNTNMSNVSPMSEGPFDGDYKGTDVDTLRAPVKMREWEADGDPDKAMKAVYEVVVGQGVGRGREAEVLLPLGREVVPMIQSRVAQYTHALEVFGEVCSSVFTER